MNRSLGNLPHAPTSFVGRERELAEVRGTLAETRLLTLTGVGGSGKTRLALRVATELRGDYADGAWWADLATVADPRLVPQVVAAALGVKEQPGQPLVVSLVEYLRSRRLLLVLDNCEHVIEACASLTQTILQACPTIRIIATSQETLRIGWERPMPVRPLSRPDPMRLPAVADLTQFDAIQLFVERARLGLPEFALEADNARLVVSICHRLDGIPLAIELAAARVKLLSLEQLDRRLDDAMRLLRREERGGVERHRTLKATLDWSYGLLTEAEQTLLRRLAVFAGGFTLEAAEEVIGDLPSGTSQSRREQGTGGAIATLSSVTYHLSPDDVLDLLAGLVDKSLVLVESQRGEVARYRLLETIRQYGQEKLREAAYVAEAAMTRRRHATFFQRLVGQAVDQLEGAAQLTWLRRLEAEQGNVRAALQWGLETTAEGREQKTEGRRQKAEDGGQKAEGGRAADGSDALEAQATAFGQHPLAVALRLVGDLWRYWALSGYLNEGRRYLEAILETQGRLVGAALATATAFETPMQREVAHLRARALRGAGYLAVAQGDLGAAQTLYEEALSLRQRVGDKPPIGRLLTNLGQVAQRRGEFARARALFEQSLALWRELGDKTGIAVSLQNLGIVANTQGDYATARPILEECLAIRRAMGDQVGIAGLLNTLGELARIEGDYVRAEIMYQQSVELNRELGNRGRLTWPLHNLGHVGLYKGDLMAATESFQAALTLAQEQGRKEALAACLAGLTCVAARTGQWVLGARLSGAADAILAQVGGVLGASDRAVYENALAILGTELGVARLEGLRAAGEGAPQARIVADALAMRGEMTNPSPVLSPRKGGEEETALTPSPSPRVGEGGQTPTLDPSPSPTRGEGGQIQAALRIFGLRQPQVFLGDRELGAADNLFAKQRELLFYLLLFPSRSRQHLGLDLWPDLAPGQLRSSLHNTLTLLRSALGHKEWIRFEGGRYSFAREIVVEGTTYTCWFDVDEFEAAVREARLVHSQQSGVAMALLQRATALYQADLLGAQAYDWATERQESLQTQFYEASLLLAQLYLEERRTGEAVEVYRRVIRHDPYQEAAQQGLMRSLALAGERAQALRHYDAYVELLAREMEIAPTAETQALADRIRRGEE